MIVQQNSNTQEQIKELRKIQDTAYINNAEPDKRMRKSGWQKEYLEEEFKKSNLWTYA
jgi:hypothetical protein